MNKSPHILQKRQYSQKKYIYEYGGNLLFLNELVNIIKDISKPRVLDIGCGSGTLAQYISFFSDVTGTEISKERFDEAIKKIQCLYDNDGNIPQGIGLFDLIYCKEVLPSIKYKLEFYKNIYKTLSKNGSFCTYIPERKDIYEKPLFKFIPSSRFITVSSYTSISNNILLLEKAGFTDIKKIRIPLGSIWINENYAYKHWDGYFNNSKNELNDKRISGLEKMISSINSLSRWGVTIHYEFERTMIIAKK